MRFLCRPIIPPRMVAMGLLSRRSGSLVLCGRTEAADAEDVHDWLADKLARRGRQGERVSERRETDASPAERMVREALAKARWREIDLATQPKGHRLKVPIAQQLRRQTPMSRPMDCWSATNGECELYFKFTRHCRE